MIIQPETAGAADSSTVTIRCPICLHNGVSQPIHNVKDVHAPKGGHLQKPLRLGIRQCPNRDCKALIFVVVHKNELVASFPPERIDFDPTDIPKGVLETFEEAITCHSTECYVAAAIMVRRTLEEICEDKGVQGKNLHSRLKALANAVILPKELLDGMFELKLLGNDAAHITSKDFHSIDKQEIDVAFMLAKEILKAVYQYSALLNALKSLKASP